MRSGGADVRAGTLHSVLHTVDFDHGGVGLAARPAESNFTGTGAAGVVGAAYAHRVGGHTVEVDVAGATLAGVAEGHVAHLLPAPS